jgi:SAM-dependent methyltransferase
MSFDRLAPHYRWMEAVLAGRKMQRCRVAWLDTVLGCRNVLVVGEGPGRFLEIAAKLLPAAEFVCVDSSAGMLERAKAAAPENARVRFVQASLPAWKPTGGPFDLVVTHFFLDCFPAQTLDEVVATLAGSTTNDARWLLADFQIPACGIARLRARLLLALAYRFFRIATALPAASLTAPDDALRKNGFQLQRRIVTDWGLLHSDVWARDSQPHPTAATVRNVSL